MYRLLLSLLLVLLTLTGRAQQSGFTGLYLMPGVTANPFMLMNGFATGTSYSLQFGVTGFPLKGSVRFGFPDYNKKLLYNDIRTATYYSQGSYFEPGLILYSIDLSKQKASFYIGAFAYLATYDHTLHLEIYDSWGTHQFEYSDQTNVKGLLIEVGGLFTIFHGLKGSVSIDLGGVKRPENPIPQIQNFINETRFIPGIGHGYDKLLFGLNFGLHYEVNMLKR